MSAFEIIVLAALLTLNLSAFRPARIDQGLDYRGARRRRRSGGPPAGYMPGRSPPVSDLRAA